MVLGGFWDMLRICGVLSVRAGSKSTLEMRLGGPERGCFLPKVSVPSRKVRGKPGWTQSELPAPPPHHPTTPRLSRETKPIGRISIHRAGFIIKVQA